MNDRHLLDKIKEFVYTYFKTRQPANLAYQPAEHTNYVVKTIKKISEHSKVDKSDLLALEMASWFQGLVQVTIGDNKEEIVANIAKEFLEKELPDKPLIAKVTALIIITKQPQKPNNIAEEIICDAVSYYLGRRSFIHINEELRHDYAIIQGKEIDRKSWLETTITMMEEHRYFTNYCREQHEATKQKNLKHLKELYLTISGDEKHHKPTKQDHENLKSSNRPDKSIETMFRITAANNQRLNALGDRKAHILITVNAIILSAIISLVLRKLDENNFLAYPSYLLLAISLLSIVYAILATRPPIVHGRFNKNDIGLKSVNILFFGNFYNMELETYTDAMLKIMDNGDILYRTLIHEDYREGLILGKKYRLLRIAYNIFMYGLITAVVVFILVSLFHHDSLPKITEPLKIQK